MSPRPKYPDDAAAPATPPVLHAGNAGYKGPAPYVESSGFETAGFGTDEYSFGVGGHHRTKQLDLPLEAPVSSDAVEYRAGKSTTYAERLMAADAATFTYKPGAVKLHQPDLRVIGDQIVDFNPLPEKRTPGMMPELAAPYVGQTLHATASIDPYTSSVDKLFGPVSVEMVAKIDAEPRLVDKMMDLARRKDREVEVPAGTTPAQIANDALLKMGAPNPKTLMGRKRLPVSSVLPWPALMRIAEAMQHGAHEAPRADGGKGYGPFNWRDQPVEAMTYIDANDRHKARWIEGQEIDPKSLAMELAHAAASLIILIDAIDNGTWIDNRPRVKSQAASRILDEYEGRSK
jgi:hypothetical protein